MKRNGSTDLSTQSVANVGNANKFPTTSYIYSPPSIFFPVLFSL